MMEQNYTNLKMAGAALGILVSATMAQAEEIRVLNWQGYGTDEKFAVELFEERTGITVVHDYFNSAEEAFTKLRTNPGAYHVIQVTSAFTQRMIDEQLLEAVDTSKLSNFSDISPNLQAHKDMVSSDGTLYNVPWTLGVNSFAINTNAFETSPDSIEVLWDPKFAGRVLWQDDATQAIGMAALATGQDINNPSDFAAITAKLKELKPQIRAYFQSEAEWNQYMSAGEFDIGFYWSGSASRSQKEFGLPVEFIIPKEGAIGWLDGLAIGAGSGNTEAALQFINWMIDPGFYVRWDTEVGAPTSANALAVSQLPEDAFNRAVLGDAEKMGTVQYMGPQSDDVREEILEVWQEVKTFYAQN